MSEYFYDPDAPVQPDQYKREFTDLLDIYKASRPMRVLEVGVREGGTLYQWIKHAQPGATIIAVDLPGATWGAWSPDFWQNICTWSEWAKERGVKLYTIVGDSHSDNTLSLFKLFGPLDFAFIDGDHSYGGVRQDWENYAAKVTAFHDILPDETDGRIQVHLFWDEIKQGRNVRELISEPNQTSRGIGVIYD